MDGAALAWAPNAIPPTTAAPAAARTHCGRADLVALAVVIDRRRAAGRVSGRKAAMVREALIVAGERAGVRAAGGLEGVGWLC